MSIDTAQDRVRQTVILAAGNGSRLGGLGGPPKPLMVVAGAPLIAHALAHAHASGCHSAIVVVGHQGNRVRSAVERMSSGLSVRFVSIPDASRPNGVSLLAAEAFADQRFFLQMVDHVFVEAALPRLVEQPFDHTECGRVLVDRAPGSDLDLDDATKVRLSGDRVAAIGKGIKPWDAIDAGCFVLTRAVFDALREVPDDAPCTVSAGMSHLAARGALSAADVRGIGWADVDTPADHRIAELLLGVRPVTA